MNLSKYFSEQARKPSGVFGKLIMANIFNFGNAKLNQFVNELLAVQENDHILEIGFGTGRLIHKMAKQIDQGLIEGVDFSDTMVSMAHKRNKKHIACGKVKIQKGNFDDIVFQKEGFDKVCSVNTIYFWKEPEKVAKKIADLLIPGGQLVVAFEDMTRLEHRKLSDNVFSLYSNDDIETLLINAGFSNVGIEARQNGKSTVYCAVAIK